MLTRVNKHIKKYNQLLAVYDVAKLEPIETVTSRADESLAQRQSETEALSEQVTALTTEDFFDEQRRAEIRETESLPTPSAVADSQREEMLDRLSAIETALSDSLGTETGLDTADDLGL